MNRYLVFLFAVVCLSALGASPNILVIITDDQGYGDLSLHGNPHLQTPHIDQLGRDGVRFDRFLSIPSVRRHGQPCLRGVGLYAAAFMA